MLLWGALASKFLRDAGFQGLLLQGLLDGLNDILYALWARSNGSRILGYVDKDALYLVFWLWWLFFALFHVKSKGAVESAEGFETAGGVFLWLNAAIVVDKVDDRSRSEDS